MANELNLLKETNEQFNINIRKLTKEKHFFEEKCQNTVNIDTLNPWYIFHGIKSKNGFYAPVKTFFQLYTFTLPVIICNKNHQLFYIVQSDFVQI